MGFHSLSIGTSALLTARYGLDVTGQNLGNVDTPGYSRQRLSQEGVKGWVGGAGNAIVGSGVWLTSIARVGNENVERQLRQANSTAEYHTTAKNCYTNLQAYFNELTGNSLSTSMEKFWGGMHDLSDEIENLSFRTTSLDLARTMTEQFNKMGDAMDQYRRDTDSEIVDSVSEINRILDGIAALNKQICTSECGGATNRVANDLRDSRGELTRNLYEYMDVDVVQEPNGSFIVSHHGRNLVYYDQVKPLQTEKVNSKDGIVRHEVQFASDGYPCEPRDGRLAAQIDVRDKIVPGYKKELNELAGNFIWEFNRAYSQTRGLETFSELKSLNKPANSAVSLDQLDFRQETAAGTFKIQNGNLEVVIQNKETGEAKTVNVEIDLDGRPGPNGEPDMILWDPEDKTAEHSFISRMQKALDEAVPGAFSVEIDRTNQVTIKALQPDAYGFCFGKDTSGVLAALGMNTFFTGYNANTMGVNENLYDTPTLMGGGYTFEKGDRDGIQALIALRDTDLTNLRGMTLEEHYQSMAGRLGSEASRSESMKSLSTDIATRMFNQREELSGVSEDEEVTKMLTYQRAFQSAAKFISTMDQLYETLINM